MDDQQGCSGSPLICTGSIGGNVVALTDQTPPYPNGPTWDAGSLIGIYTLVGITTPYNGAQNTLDIATALNDNHGNANGPPANYAAGACKTYSSTHYTDWYLPAICEMGPASNSSGCTPGTQNIVSNIPELLGSGCSFSDCLGGYYWSSTEFDTTSAWVQFFASGFGSFQGPTNKILPDGVRCVRVLTP